MRALFCPHLLFWIIHIRISYGWISFGCLLAYRNTKVPDVQARLRNAKKEEPGFSPHALAGILVLVTANFVFAMKFLAG